jgi:transposase-like protein
MIAQPLPISKVMLVCSNCGARRASPRHARHRPPRPVCRHCGEQLEVKS